LDLIIITFILSVLTFIPMLEQKSLRSRSCLSSSDLFEVVVAFTIHLYGFLMFCNYLWFFKFISKTKCKSSMYIFSNRKISVILNKGWLLNCSKGTFIKEEPLSFLHQTSRNKFHLYKKSQAYKIHNALQLSVIGVLFISVCYILITCKILCFYLA